MKIVVKDIPDDGLKLAEDLDAQTMGLGIKDRLVYESPVQVDVYATRTGHQDVRVQGQARARVNWQCSRCLTNFKRSLRQSFDLYFTQKGEDAVIDPTDMIREEILLSYPIQSHCKEDCKGLCSRCGHNSNEGPCGCKSQDASPFGKLKDLIK